MPKDTVNINQRLKILYLYRILTEETDEQHKLTIAQISDKLSALGISAGRKALYDDIEALRQYGLDIIACHEKNYTYYLGSREFELPELKLLADVVCSAKFLTEKKSAELLKKIESLASVHDGKLIQRQVYVVDRVKSGNEQIYINIDAIHRAINEGKQISFRYFDYGLDKKPKYRNGVKIASPYALTWNDEKYYMIAYYGKYGDQCTNFRVDRMSHIHMIDEKIIPPPKDFNVSDYMNSTFSMFSGNTQNAVLQFDNILINAVLDRFGKKVTLRRIDDDHFAANVKIKAEDPFFGWLFQFGTKATILSPQSLKDRYEEMLRSVLDNL